MVQKTAVCLTPMTPPITSIFGSERAGPAKSSASYKKGGNQQVSTCSLAYSWSIIKASRPD